MTQNNLTIEMTDESRRWELILRPDDYESDFYSLYFHCELVYEAMWNDYCGKCCNLA